MRQLTLPASATESDSIVDEKLELDETCVRFRLACSIQATKTALLPVSTAHALHQVRDRGMMLSASKVKQYSKTYFGG